MSEVIEIDSFYILAEEIKEIVAKLNNLHTRIEFRLRDNSEWDSTYQICLIQESINIRKTAKSLCDDLLNNRLSDPSLVSLLIKKKKFHPPYPSFKQAVSHIWHIIELYSNSPDAVIEGTHILERFFKLKMRLMIKPTNYLNTITAYVQWQNETVRCFVERFKEKPTSDRLNEIEHLWNWNFRENEGIFFGGAARPLHLKKVTEFSALMSIYYDTLWPIFKENRNALVEALNTLLHQESSTYWPKYDIFPCTSSNTIIDKCLQYFFFKDRQNTWFINSSASDYIPFISSAREIFAEKFNGSDMSLPDQHNTEWILNNLKQRCSKIYSEQSKPIIIIILTSKNRFGHRIDVDFIHTELTQRFPTIVTIVDGCQDGQAFTEVDIVIYTKRFTTTGAIGLVNKIFLSKNSLLRKRLTVGTNFPIGILAQVYININMANTGLAHGVEDLVNSSWWRFWKCPIQHELHSTFGHTYIHQSIAEYLRDPIRYSFTEDHIGIILMLTADRNGQVLLPKLWALLKKQGHSLDCFVMDNPYLKSNNGVHSDQIQELIAGKFIDQLRQIEVLSSDYLVWPLVPYWVSSPDDISVEQLNEHFEISYGYHCCLRISVGRCGYPGKLKRFVKHVDKIFQGNELNVSDDFLGKHSSQWPS
jgi:hypothetical protein